MNFVEEQKRSRRNAAYLFFTLAITYGVVVGVLYWLVAWFLSLFRPPDVSGNDWRSGALLFVVGGVLIVSGGATLVRYLQLRRGGGASIALAAGGRIVHPTTEDPAERRLNNVVDEIAIASAFPRPLIFIMDSDQSINAFAAGYGHRDAVIALTRGCVDRLDREQLAGVVAHEFSHLVNSDAAINTRLIAVTAGILVISQLGTFLISLSTQPLASQQRSVMSRLTRDSDSPFIPIGFIAGSVLWLLGLMGTLASRLIRAGVSRQREYLADASAVQYTRNPDGLAGALETARSDFGRISWKQRVISEEVNHMLFQDVVAADALTSWMASHPPIDERIARLRLTPRSALAAESGAPGSPLSDTGVLSGLTAGAGRTNALAFASMAPRASGQAMKWSPLQLPDDLQECSRELLPATGLVLACLLSSSAAVRATQLEALRARLDPAVVREGIARFGAVQRLRPTQCLALMTQCFATLRQLSSSQRNDLLLLIERLRWADHRVEPIEFALGALAWITVVEVPTEITGANPYAAATTLLHYLAVTGSPNEPHKVVGAMLAGHSALGVAPPKDPVERVREPVDMAQVDRALSVLRGSSPHTRMAFLRACEAVATFDGELTESERVVVRCMELVLAAQD